MNKPLLIALSSIALLASAGQAADQSALRFRHLEALQPLDPFLTSAAEMSFTQHTKARNLRAPSAALQAAIPAGTDVATAQALLQKAGAKCRPVQGNAETCHYFDVQTRDEYVDAVNWYVTLQLDHDRVENVAVDRTWTRS